MRVDRGLVLSLLLVYFSGCAWNSVIQIRIGMFSQICFNGDWSLLRLWREISSAQPYRMVNDSHGVNVEWPWLCPHSFYCGRSCVSGKVVIPTLLWGVQQLAWGVFWFRVLVVHRQRLKMGWSISIGPIIEGCISSSFPCPLFPKTFQGRGWGVILHLCLLPWHQLWCQFGPARDDKSEDIPLVPPRVMEMGWQWCCPAILTVDILFLFRLNCVRLWVCHR